MSLLRVERVTKRFRGLVAVDAVSLEVEKGAIFAVIGPNGAGKTTLFNLIAGVYPCDDGAIHFDGARIDGMAPEAVCALGLARTFQIVRPFPGLTVHENVAIGAMLRQARPQAAFAEAEEVLRKLDLWDRRAQTAASLTLPDRKRLEVARALATRPGLLLLPGAGGAGFDDSASLGGSSFTSGVVAAEHTAGLTDAAVLGFLSRLLRAIGAASARARPRRRLSRSLRGKA
jgi:ABC-type branched-subunit amino acid transport system ATPase component